MTEPQKIEPTQANTEPKPEEKPKPKEDWKKKFLDLEAKVKAQKESPNVQSPSSPDANPTEPTPPNHTHENCPTCQKSIGEHYVRPFDPYCPTCHEKNPTFKSLAICDPSKGGCGLPLGTIKVVEKEMIVEDPHGKEIESCPNCGGKHAKEFKFK
ncbi:MAG: hypothetical protein ABSA75_13425 [Candidatus Bathyarchaeia archaeon]|jgi:hypothetical protein